MVARWTTKIWTKISQNRTHHHLKTNLRKHPEPPESLRKRRRRNNWICLNWMRSPSKSWLCSWSTSFKLDNPHKISLKRSYLSRMLRLRRSTSQWLSSRLKTSSVCFKRRESGRRRQSTPTSANSSKSTKKTHNYFSWRTSGTLWSRCLRMKLSWQLYRRMSWPVNRKRKKSWQCSSRSKTKRMTTMTDMTRAKIS